LQRSQRKAQRCQRKSPTQTNQQRQGADAKVWRSAAKDERLPTRSTALPTQTNKQKLPNKALQCQREALRERLRRGATSYMLAIQTDCVAQRLYTLQWLSDCDQHVQN
jgi:hypothetical protein